MQAMNYMRSVEPLAAGDIGARWQTAEWMKKLTREGAADPFVRSVAAQVVEKNPGAHPLVALFRHVQAQPYATDESRPVPGVGAVVERLKGASQQAREVASDGVTVGDCDDRSVYFGALARSLGYPVRFALVKQKGLGTFSHVFPEVLFGGRWVAADTIMDGRGGRPLLAFGQELSAPFYGKETVEV
jgi:transglutaminase-like putative cysteine protease